METLMSSSPENGAARSGSKTNRKTKKAAEVKGCRSAGRLRLHSSLPLFAIFILQFSIFNRPVLKDESCENETCHTATSTPRGLLCRGALSPRHNPPDV